MAIPDPVTVGLVTAAALQVAKQAQEFVAAVTGHPGESLATILGNIANRRIANVEAITSKSHLILLDIGVEPCEVPLHILQPALEAASLQEDRDLRDIWANLLANAADPRRTNPVLPSFAIMLNELTSREVKFVEAFVAAISKGRAYERLKADHKTGGFSWAQLIQVCGDAKLLRYGGRYSHVTVAEWNANKAALSADYREFAEIIDILKRNSIIDEIPYPRPIEVGTPLVRALESKTMPNALDIQIERVYKITQLGTAFLSASRAPQKAVREGEIE